MAVNVKLSEELVNQAKHYAQVEHRSVPKQIEYWSQIGKIAAENPELPFSVIRDILIADQEEARGDRETANGWSARELLSRHQARRELNAPERDEGRDFRFAV